MDNATLAGTFASILRLETEPVAVKLHASREDLPRRPLPFPVNICQLISMARHQGRQASGVPERMVCAIGAACLGLVETPPAFRDGSAAVGRYVASREAGEAFFRNTFKLGDSGARHQAVSVAPLAIPSSNRRSARACSARNARSSSAMRPARYSSPGT